MNPKLFADVELRCPVCVQRQPADLDPPRLELVEVFSKLEGEVVEGLLRCAASHCQMTYPIVDGIPVLLADLPGYVRSAQLALSVGALHPALQGFLARSGADELRRLVDAESTYLDAHYGDRLKPTGESWGGRELFAEVARPAKRVRLAIEIGCGPGRALLELAPHADRVVGVDRDSTMLRAARRVLRGESLRFARRTHGFHYEPTTVRPLARTPNVLLVCGDGMSPPFAPDSAGRVVSLNVIDQVASPFRFLVALDRLCKAKGELVISSPYAWDSPATRDPLDVGDPAARLRAVLEAGHGLRARYRVERETNVRWELRGMARASNAYSVHLLRATRLARRR